MTLIRQIAQQHKQVWRTEEDLQLWLAGGRAAEVQQQPASPPTWQPKPEPLEGPAELSYERIVRLEWECGLCSGTINDWYRDVGQAQATDLERRRELVRRDADRG